MSVVSRGTHGRPRAMPVPQPRQEVAKGELSKPPDFMEWMHKNHPGKVEVARAYLVKHGIAPDGRGLGGKTVARMRAREE